MRETKFRVLEDHWAEPRMVYSDEYGDLSIYVSMHGLDSRHMTSTGLKDKNGKEIYEGDIVKDHHSVYMGYSRTIFEVKFWSGKFVPVSSLASGNFEVIGNIWETPELLENNH